jgi:hypothetical protein
VSNTTLSSLNPTKTPLKPVGKSRTLSPILKVSQSFTTGSEDMEEGLEVGKEEISFSPVVCLGRQ